MNIIEAAKLSDKIRRPDWKDIICYVVSEGKFEAEGQAYGPELKMHREDILAHDWIPCEDEGEKLPFTKLKILNAIRDNYSTDGIDYKGFWKSLGFKE